MSANWYEEQKTAIDERYGEDANLMTICLACTSANATIKSNFALALKAFRQIKSGTFTGEGYLPAHASSIRKALEHGEPQSIKCQAFYRALRGDKSAIVIDVWMMRWYYKGTNKRDVPTLRQYREISAKIERMAKRRKMAPRDLQAVIWAETRGTGNGAGYDYASIIRTRGAQLELAL